MNMDDIELRLLAGKPIHIDEIGSIYCPLLDEVIEIGESKYNEYLSAILINTDQLEEQVDDVSSFRLMCLYYVNDSNYFHALNAAFKFLFKQDIQLASDDSELFFVLGENEGKIYESDLDYIQFIIKKMNHLSLTSIKEEEDYNFANEQARTFIEKLKSFRKNFKGKKKENISLHSMINGMAWKSNSINIKNIFSLTIYQFREGFNAINNIDDYQYTLHGIYAGTIDPKKTKIDSLQWAKIIN